MPQQLSADGVASVFPEIEEIRSDSLRRGVAEIWSEIAAEMPWTDLNDIPKNDKGEMGRSLVTHIRGVTQMAIAICDIAKNLNGLDYDRDIMIAAGLLHDVSKPVEYEPDDTRSAPEGLPTPCRKSELGRHIQHAVYATHKIFEKGLPLELAHLVVTHTHGSNMRGKTWEAAALFYADFADTDAGLSLNPGQKLYNQRWSLGA